VGARKPEQVQQVHELIAPADCPPVCPLSVKTDSSPHANAHIGHWSKEQQNQQNANQLEQELGAMSNAAIVASILARQVVSVYPTSLARLIVLPTTHSLLNSPLGQIAPRFKSQVRKLLHRFPDSQATTSLQTTSQPSRPTGIKNGGGRAEEEGKKGRGKGKKERGEERFLFQDSDRRTVENRHKGSHAWL
jgi:hypothetical protein